MNSNNLPEQVRQDTTPEFAKWYANLPEENRVIIETKHLKILLIEAWAMGAHKVAMESPLWPAPAPEHGEPSALAVKAAGDICYRYVDANCTAQEWAEKRAGIASIIHRTFSPVAGKPQTGATDTERISLLEWLGETAFFPDWDDNGFWFAKLNGKYVNGTTLRQFCDAAIEARAAMQREDKKNGEGV